MNSMDPAEQGAFLPRGDGPAPQADALHLREPIAARHREVATPLGTMLVAVGDFDGHPAVTGAWFVGQAHFPATGLLGEPDHDGDPLLAAAAEQLTQWFARERQGFDLPLALDQKPQSLGPRVWRALQEIPYGRTTTYGEIAVALGGRSLAQAVGQAVGRNPWAVIVPCHRALGSDGGLTGYAGGLERKRALLELEGALPHEPGLF
ncbi:methylated-DNA--[protein]-cysteine S-methyltransferase [Kocuria coralli]|nr:methylated-DNA--[protein]-cysteine S-methyltransferase [Kocuria coralli]